MGSDRNIVDKKQRPEACEEEHCAGLIHYFLRNDDGEVFIINKNDDPSVDVKRFCPDCDWSE